MLTGLRPKFTFDAFLAARVAKLILVRLGLSAVILAAGIWWALETRPRFLDIPASHVFLFGAVVVLTTGYLIWLRLARALVWQIRTQFLLDALLITALVWTTGDLISPYITLYIILISIAGFFLGKMDAHAVAAACVLSFLGLSFLITQGFLHFSSAEITSTRAAQIVGFNVAAFLLVGLLAGRIADRRKIGEDLKQVESNFANLNVLHSRILASINSGLITTDLQGNIFAFNRAAEQISGFAADEMMGKSVFSVFGDEIRPRIETCLGTEAGDPTHPNLDIAIDANGRRVLVSCSITPLVGRSGGVTGLIFAFQDKTELHAMEESLRRADRLAAVGRMAAGLAHEIRNPLGSMSSALQFLSEKAKPETEDAALMSVVLSESERLNGIITDFLEYARPHAEDTGGKHRGQIDIGEAINDCLALLRHNPAVNGSHEFEVSMPEMPVVIQADESQIKQVFWNLFQNSIQAMADGGRLTVRVIEPAADRVRISVADTGKGINTDEIRHIFEPFHSGSHGTGLGLSIVHRIVMEHGGTIDVESEPGRGTSFEIGLPR